MITLTIDHKGQDYYGIKIDGVYYEVSINEGLLIENFLKTVVKIVK